MIAVIVFWISILLIIYAFFGYYFILRLLCFIKGNKLINKNYAHSENEKYPELLTLIISAYNEEDVISNKLRNSLSLDYPHDKLEILVISDGSTDQTNDIVNYFAGNGVKLLSQMPRVGKTAALNKAVSLARGKIIVFSDANSMYEKSALRNLSKHFSRSDIGFVTGRTNYISSSEHGAKETTGLYAKLEFLTKRLESRLLSCVGADGAIFAIRRKLFHALKDYDINDFVIPLNIIAQGYGGIQEEEAICFEETAKNISGEFKRQVRITCRTIRAIFNNKSLLNPFKYPLFSFELISHKLIKYLLPFFMIISFLSNMIIAFKSLAYQVILCVHIIFYLLSIVGYLQSHMKVDFKIPRIVYAFVSVSAAMFMGWVKYISGETYTTWTSERS